MADNKTLRFLAAAARVLLGLISLVGVSTAAVWAFRPNLVHRVSQSLQEGYAAKHNRESQNAEDLLGEGDATAGIETLQALLEDLSSIQKMDRLWPLKKNAFKRLIEAHVALDQTAEALAVYDRLVQLDDRDVGARLERASLLLGMGTLDGRKQGEAAIEELYAILPTAAVVIKEFLPLAIRRGDLAGVVRSTYDYHRATLDQALFAADQWRFYWKTTGPFSGAQSWKDRPVVHSQRRLEFRKSLPATEAGLRAIRVDLPRRMLAALEDLRFVFASESAELRITGKELELKLGGMFERAPGTLVSRGDDRTSFVFNLPKEFSLASGASFNFRATIVPVFPEEAISLLEDPLQVRAALAELKRAGDDGAARFLQSHSGRSPAKND